jgi:hypothetical protein
VSEPTPDYVYTVTASPQTNAKILRLAEHFECEPDVVASVAAGVALGTTIEVELEDDIWDFLHRRAEELGVSVSVVCTFAMRAYVNRRTERA